jgi:transposase
VEQLLVLLGERDRVIVELSGQVAALSARVVALEARLGQHSQNSSRPPSSDAFVKPAPRSLRRASGRAPGKQPGQAGFAVAPRPDPDEVIVHVPGVCPGCGADLCGAPAVGEERRQVFDLPPMRLVVVEHRAQRRECGCGAVTTAVFPTQAQGPTCYGPGVAALGAYLLARQHLPVQRAAEAMADCVGARVSTGWLASLLPTAAGRLGGFLEVVRARLRTAPVAHFDETGGRVGKRGHWVHVAGTPAWTLYHLDVRRGKRAMDAAGVLPVFTGVAVHDGLVGYRTYDTATHALCTAHHLRELAGIAQLTGQGWATALADLLVEIHVAVHTAKDAGAAALPADRLADYTARYHALIAEGQALNPPPPRTGKRGRPTLGAAGSLLSRLAAYHQDVLRFAVDFRVPFDNNQAERDIRMIKLQQKISGCWRSETGARSFLAVRSYPSTAAKHGHGALEVLDQLFRGQPWIPATADP